MNDCTENNIMVDYIVSELVYKQYIVSGNKRVSLKDPVTVKVVNGLHSAIPEEYTLKKLCYEMERYINNQ